MDDGPTLFVAVGDLHINSTIGLCVPRVDLDDGGVYRASKAQRDYLLRNWRRFWRDVAELRDRVRARRVIVVIGGDLVDDNSHSQAQLITVNRSVIVALAQRVLEPALEVADEVIVVRGTEAHGGQSGELEEIVAERIGAVPDPVTGQFSQWFLLAEVDGVLFDVAHHPPTFGRRPWTKAAAAARAAALLRAQYLEAGQRVPDVAIRFHVHSYQPGPREPRPEFYYGPPWQLCTAFGHRLGAGRQIEPVGGLVFECQAGEQRVHVLRYPAGRVKPWQI